MLMGLDPTGHTLLVAVTSSTSASFPMFDPATGAVARSVTLAPASSTPSTQMVVGATPSGAWITAEASGFSGAALVFAFNGMGQALWQTTTPNFSDGNVYAVFASAGAADDAVLVMGGTGTAALDAASGQVLWLCPGCGGISSWACKSHAHRNASARPAWGRGSL